MKENNFYRQKTQLNYWLESELRDSLGIQNADTKHVISEDTFIQTIQNARDKLGLVDYYPDNKNEEDIDSWVIGKLAGKEMESASEEEYLNALHRFDDITFQVITTTNLQSGWFEYIRAFIALGKTPQTIVPAHRAKMFVESISEDENSMILRLDKGLSSDNYRKAWKVLKKFLDKPRTTAPFAELLKNKIYLDRQNGMTYGQLAKKYFPFEHQKDKADKTDFARDKVKKIIARYKKPK